MIPARTEEAERRSAAAIDVALGLLVAALSSMALLWLIPAQISTEATGTDVSPAFIPQLAAGVMLVLSVCMVAHRILRERPAGGWARGRPLMLETATLAAGAAAISIAIPLVGFLPVAVAVILAGGLFARYRPLWALGLLAVLFPLLVDFGAWTIFVVDLP